MQLLYNAAQAHGFPASLPTDNGAVFTGTSRKGKVLLATELENPGILVKLHPLPHKIERFPPDLERYLGKQVAASSLAELQLQLDRSPEGEHPPARPRLSLLTAACRSRRQWRKDQVQPVQALAPLANGVTVTGVPSALRVGPHRRRRMGCRSPP